MKVCSHCNVNKPVEHFYVCSRAKDGREGRCKKCYRLYNKDPESKRNSLLKHRFGITSKVWDSLFDSQGSCCSICLSTESRGMGWQTDHDHSCCNSKRSCGKCVRGILCTPCNLTVGFVENGWSIVIPEIEKYLNYWRQQHSKEPNGS